MQTLNLGILSHPGAGKTSLTERLLCTGGVLDETGSADEGSTQTGSLVLERHRGITIKSGVISFTIGDIRASLIDIGHPDFIAEVQRGPGVLDGAALVIWLVEGVLAQARVLMRTLQRQLPGLMGGARVFESSSGGYQPVSRTPPARRRTMANPLNRDEYMMRFARRAIRPANRRREAGE